MTVSHEEVLSIFGATIHELHVNGPKEACYRFNFFFESMTQSEVSNLAERVATRITSARTELLARLDASKVAWTAQDRCAFEEAKLKP